MLRDFSLLSLKEMENKILGAEDRLYSLENSIYNQILG
jgi:hypothetical protein